MRPYPFLTGPCSWQKTTKEINYEYQPMEWLNPTSNAVERLFSGAKNVVSDQRMSMLPMNLEETLLYIHSVGHKWTIWGY